MMAPALDLPDRIWSVAAARQLRGLIKTETQDSVDGVGSGLDVTWRMTMPVTPTEILRHHVERRPKATAFVFGEDVWTYERLGADADRVAHAFVALGLRPGDRVALHMVNRPEMLVAYYACFQVGLIAAPLRTAFKPAELIPLLGRMRPSLYIGDAALYGNVAGADPSILPAARRFLVGAAEDRRAKPWSMLLGGLAREAAPAVRDVHAPAVMLNTSGTTGEPKFIVHTAATLSACVEILTYSGLSEGEVAVEAVPLAHASGLFTFLAYVRCGMPFVLLEQFDPDAVLDAIERHRCNWVLAMPSMFADLLARQRARPRNVSSLRMCLTGGDVCPLQLQEQFPVHFGVPLRIVWAATEVIAFSYGLVPGPVSRIVPGVQFRLVDHDGADVPCGETGELLLRGPNITVGYWAGPGQIADPLNNGWFHTGDLMQQGEGEDLWFVGRKKDLIIRGGTNISPVEVEQVLATAHPEVQGAAVAGLPDAVLGERVVGFVELANGGKRLVLEEILATARSRLADYKVPEILMIIDAIPRNALGKVDRKLLARMSAELLGGRPERFDRIASPSDRRFAAPGGSTPFKKRARQSK